MMKAVEERKRNSHGGRFRPAEAEDHMFLVGKRGETFNGGIGCIYECQSIQFSDVIKWGAAAGLN